MFKQTDQYLCVSSIKLLESRSTSLCSANSIQSQAVEEQGPFEEEDNGNSSDTDSLQKQSAKILDRSECDKHSSFVTNPKLMQSISSLDMDTQKTIIRLITAVSILFFIICFTMIVFTLRYSESVDARIRTYYMTKTKIVRANSSIMSADDLRQDVFMEKLKIANSKYNLTPDKIKMPLSRIHLT